MTRAGPRRWAVRLLAWAAVVTGAVLLGRWLGYDIDTPRLAILMGLPLAAAWLVVDVEVPRVATWRVEPLSVAVVPGADARLTTDIRVIEDHLAARTPSPALRDRLAAVAEVRLARRGVRLRDPAAGELLGSVAVGALTGPVRLIRPAELDRIISRIEEL